MAKETENSLEDLLGIGEGGCNPKDDKTLNGAITTTTSTTVTITTTTTTSTSTVTTATATTASSKTKESGCTAEGGAGGACGSDLDCQANTADNSGSSPGSSVGRSTRLRPRIYRPRLSESSSEDSDNETEIETSRRLRSRVTITGGGGMAGKDAASPASTEPSQEEVEMEPVSPEGMETAGGNTDVEATDDSPTTERRRVAPERSRGGSRNVFGLLTDSDSDSDDTRRRRNVRDPLEDETQRKEVEAAISAELMRIRQRPKPKHEWNFVKQIVQRQFGGRAHHQSSVLFSHHYYDSLHVPKRLELMYKMEFHSGCVNALSFNSSGTLLASGSDDFYIAVWDWAREKAAITFKSGHHNNVFQSKFLPLSDDTLIVSCARDGQVRLAELSSGVYKSTRKLAKHNGPAHKLATLPTSPHVVLSAGEDAVVLNIDIRQEQPNRVALVKGLAGARIPLYSIHAHPVNEHQFCVSGHDQFVRVYDRRCASLNFPVLKFCPRNHYEANPPPSVTCAVYSCNGDAILASYNDDDIYLFDTMLSEAADAIHKYSGHRNSATVKGVNFFGPGNQYIVSGSDCGNIFFWHRETEAIVQCMPGDENGVVNVLEPHPHIPVLATSGLDDDIKIWVPTCEEDPPLPNLEQIIKTNLMKRHKDRTEDNTPLDTQMLMVLWHHIRRTDRRQRRMAEGSSTSNGSGVGGDGGGGGGASSSDDSNESDDSESQRGVQCATH